MTDPRNALLDEVLESLAQLGEDAGLDPQRTADRQFGAKVVFEALLNAGLLRNGVFTMPSFVTVDTPTGSVTVPSDPVTRNDPLSNAERQRRYRERHRNVTEGKS